jgi:hypothetical protein
MARLMQVFKVRDHNNLEFWVSNLIVMASTIIGVFLAAQAGYKTALEFEVARTQRDSYYMRRALLDEVKDNLAAVDDWSANIEKTLRNRISADYFLPTDSWVTYWSEKNGHSSGSFVPDEIKMKNFVWETMKQQSTTFQLPPDMLSAVRRFYDSMDGNDKDMRSKSWKSGVAAKAIAEDTKRMRTELVPVFEKNTAKLRAKLEAKGVPLDE